MTVAVDEEGQFLAAWAENFGRVRACGYDRDGVQQGCVELDLPGFTSPSPIHANARGVGEFVVVWVSLDADSGLKGRWVAADGTPLGADFDVPSSGGGYPRVPRVAIHPADVLLTVWVDDNSVGNDNDGDSIQARFLTPSGAPIGDRFQVNTTAPGQQFYPDIAMAPDGHFVVTWSSQSSSGTDDSGLSIQAQRFTAGGAFAGSEFQVNTYIDGHQSQPRVAMSDDGSFVVVWHSPGSSGNDTDGWSIQGRRFAADGSPLGDDFQVNSYTAGNQFDPSVGVIPGGGFEVLWDSEGSFGDDNDSTSIQRQAYSPDGSPSGSQLQVNTTIHGGQGFPEVSMNHGGDFVAIWGHSGGYIRGRAFRGTIFSDGFEIGDWSAWSLTVP
jgi:hypothetical protein